MRIWDNIDPQLMCRQHLLGEHRELHGLWQVLSKIHQGTASGYSKHPETRRWVGHEKALRRRHQLLVEEMLVRGWKHSSPLPEMDDENSSSAVMPEPIDDQKQALREKDCDCAVA